jgi:hypothetical protein
VPAAVGLRCKMRSFVFVCKALSSQTLRGVIVVILCTLGTKFCSAFFTRSCGRRQRASAGAAVRAATRAKTAPCGGSRRDDLGAALGFGLNSVRDSSVFFSQGEITANLIIRNISEI